MKIETVVSALSAYYKTFSHGGGVQSPADLIVGYPANRKSVRIAKVSGKGLGVQTQQSATLWLDVSPGVVAMKIGADRVAATLLGGPLQERRMRGNECRFDSVLDHWFDVIRDLFVLSDLTGDLEGTLLDGRRFALNRAELDEHGLEELFERMAGLGVPVEYGNLEHHLLPGLYTHIDVNSDSFKQLTQSADEAFEEFAK